MKRRQSNVLSTTESNSHRFAFLTGRVVQFIESLSQSANVPADELATWVRTQLGDGASGEVPRSAETVPEVPQTSSAGHTAVRKVAVASRTRKRMPKIECTTCHKLFKGGVGLATHLRKTNHGIYRSDGKMTKRLKLA